MPRFGIDGMLEPAEISDVAEYVRSLSGTEQVDTAAAERGKAVFAEQCAACHGEDAKGNQEMGAPNLTDAIWLYGSRRTPSRRASSPAVVVPCPRGPRVSTR